jgi:tetratricopeptide (TPR) repeat protein
VQLEQSPFLFLVSENKINQTMKLMGRPPGERLTPELTREVCQRTGSEATLTGSIAGLGSQYVIGLKAVNCASGDVLAEAQEQAAGKEMVLKALDSAAVSLRSKLGESLGSVQKYATPLEEATTPSLEALQAYSLGVKALVERDDNRATVSLTQQAVRLDPNFGMAYALLGVGYQNLGETTLAAEYTRKAYELRERVSEREKFQIESVYYDYVTGNVDKARQVYELWAQTYPRDDVPPTNLSVMYRRLGQHDKSLAEAREAIRLDPASGNNYVNLFTSYFFLNRLDETQATIEEAQAKNLDTGHLHFIAYRLALLRNDVAGMAQQVAWAAGKPGVEDVMLASEADTVAYSGRLGKARELTRRAVASALHAEEKETAAGYEASAAVREALFGNPDEGRQRVAAALKLSTGRDVQYQAALALAFMGDAARAQALANDLSKRYPEDTIVQFIRVPTLNAQLALNRNDAAKAIDALQPAGPYELGNGMQPIYLRGEAYLAAHQGNQAAAEFQKIIDHRVLALDAIGALAHLGLARAYVLQSDTGKAKAAYHDFLTLWKDADPDPEIPILKKAKAEYSSLQ